MENSEYQVSSQPYGPSQSPLQVTHVFVEGGRSNGMGVAGFVLALLSFLFSWIPLVNFVDIILWPLGFIFSFIGLFKSPRGLAITGLILSLLSIMFGVLGFFGLLAILSNAS